MRLRIESCAALHIGDRDEQQDRVAIFVHPKYQETMLIALADGMGGLSGGSVAAEQVLMVSQQCFEAHVPGDPLPQLLAEILESAHNSICLAAMSSNEEPHSTACVMVLEGGAAYWAHCGDSRIYHFRAGRLVSRSLDHSVVMRRMVMPGFLSEEQAESHPKKNILSSCLGDEVLPEVDFGEVPQLQAGDCFLICSDGLWAHFTTQELAEALECLSPKQVVEVLTQRAREKGQGKGDNISLAVVKVQERSEEKKVPAIGRLAAN